MKPEREIRVLTESEVGTLLDWAAAEGWNPGLDDLRPFRAADPDGFLGAFASGRMAAGIAAIAYGADFGFIGLYICHPDQRGAGHGRAVWDAGMARLRDRTISLDGVPAQQSNYRRMGFAPVYETVRFSGRFAAAPEAGDAAPLTPELLPAILDFDRRWFPAPRASFLEAWLAAPRRASVVLAGGKVTGYGVARPCRSGWKIGPLFAADDTGARSLLYSLAQVAGEDEVHIDVPAPRQGFSDFLRAAGFSPGFETARMYRGEVPAVTGADAYAVTTLELG